MAMTPKQQAAIAAIVLVGGIATGAVLMTGRSAPHDHAGHTDAEAHTASEPHANEQAAHAAPASAPGAPAAANATPDKVVLTPAQLAAAAVTVQAAAPARLRTGVAFPGEIRFNEDRTAHVVPRLTGVVESVPANIGQQVRKGQVLAVLASSTLSDQRSELLAAQQRLDLARVTFDREKRLFEQKISAEQDYLAARNALQEAQISVRNARQKLTAIGASDAATALNRYELRAPFDGLIVEKHIALGEAVADNANVFTLSDLSSVWAEFVVSAKDLEKVRVGEKATITSTSSDVRAEGTVSYVGSLLGEQTRTAKARVTLTNPQMAWRPGLFVTVDVYGAEVQVPVAVQADAVQQIDGRPAVFVAVADGFVVRPVKTGRADGRVVEIVDGLAPGTRYAAANSFVLKAELGKAGAEHSH